MEAQGLPEGDWAGAKPTEAEAYCWCSIAMLTLDLHGIAGLCLNMRIAAFERGDHDMMAIAAGQVIPVPSSSTFSRPTPTV